LAEVSEGLTLPAVPQQILVGAVHLTIQEAITAEALLRTQVHLTIVRNPIPKFLTRRPICTLRIHASQECSLKECCLARKKRRKRKGHYHTGVHVSVKGGECKYRSGWELKYMEHMDSDDKVLRFEYEQVKIPYISNVRTGKIRHYYPDFLVTYVDGTQKLVEIKPKKRLDQAKVTKKLKAAEVWCREHGVTLAVLTEIELRLLGLLK